MFTMRTPFRLLFSAALVVVCSSNSAGPAVTQVTVTPTTDRLYTGQFVSLSVTARDVAGNPVTGQAVAWHSSDSLKATISGSGVVAALDSGDVVMTATVDGVQGQGQIHIRLIPVGSVTISPRVDTLAPGHSAAFSVVVKDSTGGTVLLNRHVTWSSSNPVLLTVTTAGVATVHDTGAAFLRANVEGKTDSAHVVGSPAAPSGVTLTPAGDTVGVSDTVTVKTTVTTSLGDTVTPAITFGSSDSGIATVSPAGLVTAVNTGTVTISATAGSAVGSAQFLVASCTTSVSLSPNSWAFILGAGGFRSSGVTDQVLFKTVGVAFAAAPIYGRDSTHFVMGYNPGTGASDLASSRVCTLSSSPLHAYAKLRTSSTLVAGLATTEEVFAGNTAGVTDVVLFRYTYTNTGTTAITNFYGGLLADWDLNWDSSPTDDNVRWNSSLGIEEAVETDTVTHPQIMAIVPIAATGAVTAHAWTNAPGEPVRGGLFDFLTARDTTLVGPNDIRGMMGRGPVTIAAGGKYVVVFALVGGSTRSAFNSNVAAAQTAAAALP